MFNQNFTNMRKITLALCLLVCVLFLAGGIKALAQTSSDKTIVLLTNPDNGNDEAQYNWLVANGFNVTRLNAGSEIDLKNPTQETIDQLNAADLVIAGRDLYSGSYDGRGQDVIDSITAPVITNNPYGAKWGVPPLWFYNPVMADVSGMSIWVKVVKTDPIFANSHVVGDSILYANGGCAFIITTGGHNGTVIASNNGNIGIVRFAKDVPYNDSTGAKTPKSDRTIFPFQTSTKSFSLSTDGQAAYYAEICRLAGLPITAPVVYYNNNALKTIVLLTNPANGNDEAQYQFLIGNGFNVTRLNAGSEIDLKNPTQVTIDQLNAADLVITGRDLYSGSYDGRGQDVIDSITAPVITNNPYGAKWGVPPLWFYNPVMADVSGMNIWVKVVKTDPIFANSHVVGDSILYANGGCAFIITTGGHNGTVLASNNGNIGIVRFAKDVPYNDSIGAKTPKSDRTIFPFQTGTGSFTLSTDGQAAYYAEIRRLLGYGIEAPPYYYQSSISTLSTLEASVGTLDPAFSEGVTTYSLIVPVGTTSVTLTATATNANATVTGDGDITDVPSTATIIVTAQDGVSVTNYVVNIAVGTGVKDLTAAGISIYPVPVRESLTVDGLTPGARIHVISATGQLISSTIANGNRMELDLGQLRSGIYLMKVETDGKSFSSRFIKQ
jgi:hypothetical protein